MPRSEAIRPLDQAPSTSSAVRASTNSSGNRSTNRYTASICSSVAVTAAGPASEHGTNTDQNWAPRPPWRSRGRSVCKPAADWSRDRSTASRS